MREADPARAKMTIDEKWKPSHRNWMDGEQMPLFSKLDTYPRQFHRLIAIAIAHGPIDFPDSRTICCDCDGARCWKTRQSLTVHGRYSVVLTVSLLCMSTRIRHGYTVAFEEDGSVTARPRSF
nr:hypothetical protein CFP56_10368 [Quercus suber]